jgi:hypothetical protein
MTRSFFSNFNARLMIIHFIAFWLFIWAFETLAFLHDYEFLFSITQTFNRINLRSQVNADLDFIMEAGNIGLLAGYVMSWIISTKKGWHWINSIVIFVLAFLIRNFLTRSFPDNILLLPGGPFRVYSIWAHIVLPIILIGVGLLLFFSKQIIRFIDPASRMDKKGASISKKSAKVKHS